jgi:tetratricopeptide (TPR) repeat protein
MRRFLLLTISFLFLLSGCKTLFHSSDTSSKKEDTTQIATISERDQLKYHFAFVEGLKQKALENYSKAISYFYKCLEIQPESPAVQYQISLINNILRESDVALRYAKKAVKNDPENKYYREHLFQLYLRHNKPKDAIKQYKALLDQGHTSVDYYYDLAQLYRKTKQYDKAIEMLEKLEQRAGINEQISILKKILYSKVGEREKAIQEVQKLIRNYPQESNYYGMLAELYASYKQYDKADEMYEKLFKLDSTNKMGQLSLVKYYESQHKYDKALEQYIKVAGDKEIDFGSKYMLFMKFLEDKKIYLSHKNKIIEALDSLQAEYPERKEVHTLYADLYLKSNNFKKAGDHLEPLVNSKKEKPVYWEQLLSIYSYTNQFEKLYSYGTKGIEKYQSNSRMYLLTGIGAIQSGKADTAITILKSGLDTFSSNSELLIQFYTQLGEAYHNTGNHEKSDYYFELVLEKQPNNLFISNNYSYYLSLRGEKLDRALELIKNTIKEEPNSSIYLDTYAWVLYKLGKYNKAEKHIEKAIHNNGSDDPEILEHYGDILFKNGKVDQAVKQWEKSQAAGNDSEAIKYKIKNKKLLENK